MQISPNRLDRHVIVDLETTGLWPRRGHRVIEIGAVAVEGGAVVDEFATLIDAGVTILTTVQAIHCIADTHFLRQNHRALDDARMTAKIWLRMQGA